jgi:hypothetical protein
MKRNGNGNTKTEQKELKRSRHHRTIPAKKCMDVRKKLAVDFQLKTEL